MMSIDFTTPQEMLRKIAKRVRERRLALNFSQRSLALKSGVSYGTLKNFEQHGQISLLSLLKLAIILGNLKDFEAVFTPDMKAPIPSLEALMNDSKRQRGRK